MAHPFYHARSSAKKFGGVWQDYLAIHEFMDHTKAFIPDARHRLLLHNAWGIFIAERVFGTVITRASDGKVIPLRPIVEQHILEDFGGRIPTLEACWGELPLYDWAV